MTFEVDRELRVRSAAFHRQDRADAELLVPDFLAALELSGDGWLTTTRLRGATWLRAGVLNYLATEADIDRLLDTLRELAATA